MSANYRTISLRKNCERITKKVRYTIELRQSYEKLQKELRESYE